MALAPNFQIHRSLNNLVSIVYKTKLLDSFFLLAGLCIIFLLYKPTLNGLLEDNQDKLKPDESLGSSTEFS